ncbi:MAG TPA: tetratricopeptide repeat protein [Candidatus Ozemobacteraceae bacterium]|nr:tetratricopeptide repeat protein [Candidatus Ozemobacteraceae bacterium]
MKPRNPSKRKTSASQAAKEQAFLQRALLRSAELRRMGNPDYGYRLLDRIGHRFPLAWQVHFGMGGCALAMGAFGNAIQGFAAASALAPEADEPKLGYAETLAAAGAEDRAMVTVKEILARKPNLLGARLVYGKMFELRAEWNRALGQYREVDEQETDPAYPELLNRIGFCYLNMDDPGRALERFNEAVHLQGDNPDFLYNRGHCFGTLGQFAEALTDFEAVVRLDPGDAEALAFAALYLFYQGERQLALARVEMALEMWPDNPEILDIREEIVENNPPDSYRPDEEEEEEE